MASPVYNGGPQLYPLGFLFAFLFYHKFAPEMHILNSASAVLAQIQALLR